MIRFIYNITIIPIIYTIIYIIAIFNRKANQAIKGRKRLISRLKVNKIRLNPYKKTILFHCVSMGEYKQALPIINKFIEKSKDYNIILSLFSPSVFNNIENVPSFDIITYIPFDTYFKTKRFLDIIQPDLVLISKHDIWPNFIWELKKRQIPTYLVNALYALDSKIGHWYIKPFFKLLYKNLTNIITVDEENKKRFLTIYPYPDRLFISGDSRFDTVIYDAKNSLKIPILENLKETNRKIFVAGSSWPQGEKFIINAWKNLTNKFDDISLIIVPHEINSEHIYKIEAYCQDNGLSSTVFSDIDNESQVLNTDILIIDKIGILTSIYKYAFAAYVGGGFGKDGLHSVLEPAAYEIPVFFGHNLDKSPEGMTMLKQGCGFRFYNSIEFETLFRNIYKNKKLYKDIAQKSSKFIKEKAGATEKIFEIVTQSLANTYTNINDKFSDETLQKMLDEYD